MAAISCFLISAGLWPSICLFGIFHVPIWWYLKYLTVFSISSSFFVIFDTRNDFLIVPDLCRISIFFHIRIFCFTVAILSLCHGWPRFFPRDLNDSCADSSCTFDMSLRRGRKSVNHSVKLLTTHWTRLSSTFILICILECLIHPDFWACAICRTELTRIVWIAWNISDSSERNFPMSYLIEYSYDLSAFMDSLKHLEFFIDCIHSRLSIFSGILRLDSVLINKEKSRCNFCRELFEYGSISFFSRSYCSCSVGIYRICDIYLCISGWSGRKRNNYYLRSHSEVIGYEMCGSFASHAKFVRYLRESIPSDDRNIIGNPIYYDRESTSRWSTWKSQSILIVIIERERVFISYCTINHPRCYDNLWFYIFIRDICRVIESRECTDSIYGRIHNGVIKISWLYPPKGILQNILKNWFVR